VVDGAGSNWGRTDFCPALLDVAAFSQPASEVSDSPCTRLAQALATAAPVLDDATVIILVPRFCIN
jgi:hypothetical protein